MRGQGPAIGAPASLRRAEPVVTVSFGVVKGRELSKRGVRSHNVVVDPSFLDQATVLAERGKQVLVQATVPKRAV